MLRTASSGLFVIALLAGTSAVAQTPAPSTDARPAGAPAPQRPPGIPPRAQHPIVPPGAAPAMPKAGPNAGGAKPAGAAAGAPHVMRPPALPGAARPVAGGAVKPGSGIGSPGAPPAPPGPRPPAELEQLKFLRGRWLCAGKQFATPLYGPEHKFVATAEARPAVDGFWDQFFYEEKKSKEHHGFKAQGLWGWDQGARHFVRTGATNAGDWDTGSAPGLEGDKLVWTGEFSGSLGRMPYRQTVTRKSDKEWSLALDLKDVRDPQNPQSSKDSNARYLPINDVVCKPLVLATPAGLPVAPAPPRK